MPWINWPAAYDLLIKLTSVLSLISFKNDSQSEGAFKPEKQEQSHIFG